MGILRTYTPKIRAADGVAELKPVMLGGVTQWVLIRGENVKNPLLVFLHGGPGMPMMYLAHRFGRHLEDQFTVVHWDQRGAGKSYGDHVPAGSMTDAQLVSDACELVDTLLHRFQQRQVYLVGHSHGSLLGMLLIKQRPEIFKAFVSVGQEVHVERSRVMQAEFIRAKAQELNEQEAIAQLDQHGHAAHEDWLFRFGGELHQHKSLLPLIWAGLRAPEYSLRDFLNVPKGPKFTHKHFRYVLLLGDVMDSITEVKVPVHFFAGRYDMTTPYPLISDYYQLLAAPEKSLVTFEHSAHFPFFEEPERFARELKQALL